METNYRTESVRLRRKNTYFRAQNNHIFLGTKDIDKMHYLKMKSIFTVHIFITEKSDVNDTLHDSIFAAMNNFHHKSRIFIHIPKPLKDLKFEVAGILFGVPDNRVRILCEKKLPEFCFDPINRYYLSFSYDGWHLLADIHVASKRMMEIRSESAIQNEVQAAHPDEFKDQIIANFKAITPLGILKSFKNEKDIWDYIKQEGDWETGKKDEVLSVSKDEVRMRPVNITLPEGEDPEKAIKNMVDNAVNNLKQ